jgi:arylsulfatase A-like enzyme
MRVFNFLLVCLLSSVPLAHGADAAQLPKLNVLLIMADDLRDHGGAFTRDIVKTPNLDRLRARGVTFERAYV